MKKRNFLFIVVFLLILLILPFVFASVDDEINKITYYAQEYESGNINYVQLLVYTSSIRQNLNEILGATEKQEGGILKVEQIKTILGEPTETTKWIWVEKEEREEKYDSEIPVWRKIIFDGNKIQIRIDAYPSLFAKKTPEIMKKIKELKEDGEDHMAEIKELEKSGEKILVYRLNFQIEFKKPEEQLDLNSKISNIKSLAEKFSSDPSSSNAEELAKQTVNVEKSFESFYKQSSGKCEDIMKSIFGSENIRKSQKIHVQEFVFYSGDNYEVKMRLETCEDCKNSWVNLNSWIERRGPGKMEEEDKDFSSDPYRNLAYEEIKNEILNVIEDYKKALENKDLKSASSARLKLDALNQIWNEKSKDVWKEVEKEYELKRREMEKTMQNSKDGNNDPFWWVSFEKEKQKRANDLVNQQSIKIKEFYEQLFSSYEKRDFYYDEINFEKRLIEEFKIFGKEICDNNQDDNKDDKIDCGDEQCGGKICGKQKISISDGNLSSEKTVDLYCINSECVQKEEIIEKEPICGNHICEKGESNYLNQSDNNSTGCPEDCSICPEYTALKCDGKVIFKGKDKNGCSLEPICLEEKDICEKNEDCVQPLCGKAECVRENDIGKCKVISLEECKESECIDGEERVQNCASGEKLIIEICENGLWKKTGVEKCKEEEKIEEKPVSGNECVVKEDCGGKDDVCSNGKCVSIPQNEIIEELVSENIEQPIIEKNEEVKQEKSSEQQSSEQVSETNPLKDSQESNAPITGGVITGFDVESQNPDSSNTENSNPETKPATNEINNQDNLQNNQNNEEQRKEDNRIREEDNVRREEERKNQEKEDRERRNQECVNNCERRCNDELIMPCVGNCVFKDNQEKELEECKQKCRSDKENDIRICLDECSENCKQDKGYEIKRDENENKQEKGVFQLGGSCRTSQNKIEAHLYFGGWGDPFEKIQPLKQKYYSGGNADWCKWELENLKKQRAEFERGFNSDFLKWFFDEYMANSAEDWEEHVSGIYEIYWKSVDNSRETAFRMNCIGKNELSDYNLININYTTEYGSVEYWEELKEVNMPGIENPIKVISPYMKVWIFPPKDFIKYEMKKSMKTHEFPGKSEDKLERKNEEGPTAEEREMIKQDKSFMNKIKAISEKYNGNVDIVVQVKDTEKNDTIFNLYVQVNENDIIKIKPMLPEEVPSEDIKIEVDFEKIFDLIYTQEKEMDSQRIESPPWDKKEMSIGGKIKDISNGIKMYFKIRDILNSAKVSPESSKKEVISLAKNFMSKMKEGENKNLDENQMKELEKEKEQGDFEDDSGNKGMTGKVVWSR